MVLFKGIGRCDDVTETRSRGHGIGRVRLSLKKGRALVFQSPTNHRLDFRKPDSVLPREPMSSRGEVVIPLGCVSQRTSGNQPGNLTAGGS